MSVIEQVKRALKNREDEVKVATYKLVKIPVELPIQNRRLQTSRFYLIHQRRRQSKGTKEKTETNSEKRRFDREPASLPGGTRRTIDYRTPSIWSARVPSGELRRRLSRREVRRRDEQVELAHWKKETHLTRNSTFARDQSAFHI